MPKLVPEGSALTSTIGVRLPARWLDQINYLAELQGVRLSEQLRELIQAGGDYHGLDLDQ